MMAAAEQERAVCKRVGLHVGDKYRVVKKIGSGSFGDVYSGHNTETGDEVAIKFECKKTSGGHLYSEKCVYQQLKGSHSVPRLHWYGSEGNCNVLVMQLLGKSLEQHFKDCQRHFSLKTVLMLADQMVQRLQHLHLNHIIHRDIKPDNFVMGLGTSENRVYIIDFGLSKKYRDQRTLCHIKYRDHRPLTGTIRYASLRTHAGVEQSRRDDLESLGYVLMYFNRGTLPWQGLKSCNNMQHAEVVAEKKISTTLKELCKGYPQAFAVYLQNCRNLRFDEAPKYDFLRKLFAEQLRQLHYKNDYAFDWKFLVNRNRVHVEPNRVSRMQLHAPEADQAIRTRALPEKTTLKQEPNKPQQYVPPCEKKLKVSCHQVLLDPKILKGPAKPILPKSSIPVTNKYMARRVSTAQVEQPQVVRNMASNVAIRQPVQRTELRGAVGVGPSGDAADERRRTGEFFGSLLHSMKARNPSIMKSMYGRAVAEQVAEMKKKRK